MLSKWSQNRKPLSEGKIRAKLRLLEELAYHFSCEGKELFSSDDLYDKVEDYLQVQRVSVVFKDAYADELIAELFEEDGILQKLERDGDRYLFLHRTFQEYLTASYLKRAIQKNQSKGLALAREHFWEYDWHETLSLLAGLMENPVLLLQAITAEKDDIFKTLLFLAGRCLAECQAISHPLIVKIIDRIYKFWQSYPNADFINSTVVALGKVNSQIVQRLQEALNDSSSYMRKQTVEALGNIGNAQAVDALITALNDSESKVRREAAEALGKIGNPQAVSALIASLNNLEWIVRRQAAEALGEIGNAQAVDALIAALNDSESYVRSEAAEALGKIGNAQTLKNLIGFWEIDIYRQNIFRTARTLAVRFSKEKHSFIPVYPELVRLKYSPILATVKRLWRSLRQKTREKRSTG